jgi:nitrite reductase/ring-hydroxylating ferredoxin subunit
MAEVSIGKADLKPGQSRCVNVNGNALALANINGTYYCIDNACSHSGGSLCDGELGELGATTVTCPLHAAVFDYTDGSVLRGPAMEPVKSYDVKERNGELFIEM